MLNHATVQEVLETELKYKREEVIAKEAALVAERKAKDEALAAKEAALAAERKAKDEALAAKEAALAAKEAALAAERKAKDEAVAKQHKLELEQQRNGPRLERLHVRFTFGARLASACLEGHCMPL